jgi:hypothetical protein
LSFSALNLFKFLIFLISRSALWKRLIM